MLCPAYLGNHPTTIIPVSGYVLGDKEKMIERIEEGFFHYGEAALSGRFQRMTMWLMDVGFVVADPTYSYAISDLLG